MTATMSSGAVVLRWTLRKRSRPEVAVDCDAAVAEAATGEPSGRRKRKGVARKPLEILGTNTSKATKKNAIGKARALESSRRRRSSTRVACQNILRERAARQIQCCFR